MGKKNEQEDDTNKNKGHKTLRQKLRKKREELKRHKKEKSDHKKLYDAEEMKEKFFSKGNIESQKKNEELRYQKIQKYINQFINIYEDDLQDFFSLFQTFDKSGFIDISQLQNKKLQKCLKKLFKYLPLKRNGKQYQKRQDSSIKLEELIRNVVSSTIQDYLENGSASLNQESSNEQLNEGKNQQKQSKKKKKTQIKNEQNEVGQLRLYKQVATESSYIGPMIPPEERQKIAKLFDEQLQQMKQDAAQEKQAQDDEFNRIFSMSKGRREVKPKTAEKFPQHLLAAGSAQLGEKVQVDQEELEEYNKTFRPRKLIDEHKQMLEKKRQAEGITGKSRKPFNRQRDIVNGGSQMMTNSTFFDFRSRMTKPSTTNNFL